MPAKATVLSSGFVLKPWQTCLQLFATLSLKFNSCEVFVSIDLMLKNIAEMAVVTPSKGATKKASFEYPA